MIYLIAGPPCSGKTTLARKLAKPTDPFLDFDEICRELDGRPGWDHDYRTQVRAEELMTARLADLRGHQEGQAWVTRCAPDAKARQALAASLNATVWLLNPGKAECRRRARQDSRPRSTFSGIDYWFRTYRPAPCDSAPPTA